MSFGAAVLYSSRWIEDVSSIRLPDVTGSYAFRSSANQRRTREYVLGDDLQLFTQHAGYDPEVIVAAGAASRGTQKLMYPRTRTLAIGLRLQC